MWNISKLALWLFLSALVIGTAASPVSAGFTHPRGLMMSTYPQQILVFYASGDQSVQLIVIIMPPWYFVDNLYAFDTVTLTATLKPTTLQSNSKPLQLLGGSDSNGGSTVTFQWTNLAMDEDEGGGYLLCTITFLIGHNTSPNTSSARGYYLLILSARATAGDVLFIGWDQIGVSLRPGHIPTQPPLP
jgi:hypothetical protein